MCPKPPVGRTLVRGHTQQETCWPPREIARAGHRRVAEYPVPSVSVVPSQRFLPQVLVQRSSAGAESQAGMWTPLVTCAIGISSSGQRGKRGRKRRRLTFPCKRLTPFATPLPRIARYAMLKCSDESVGFSRPRASKSLSAMPSFCWAYPPRYCSMSEGAKRSKPAASAVCVVNRLPGRVAASATSKAGLSLP